MVSVFFAININKIDSYIQICQQLEHSTLATDFIQFSPRTEYDSDSRLGTNCHCAVCFSHCPMVLVAMQMVHYAWWANLGLIRHQMRAALTKHVVAATADDDVAVADATGAGYSDGERQSAFSRHRSWWPCSAGIWVESWSGRVDRMVVAEGERRHERRTCWSQTCGVD